jgi:hypothetical protein
MPVPATFEEAVGQLRKWKPEWSEQDAVNHISQRIEVKDPLFTAIPDVQNELRKDKWATKLSTPTPSKFSKLFQPIRDPQGVEYGTGEKQYEKDTAGKNAFFALGNKAAETITGAIERTPFGQTKGGEEVARLAGAGIGGILTPIPGLGGLARAGVGMTGIGAADITAGLGAPPIVQEAVGMAAPILLFRGPKAENAVARTEAGRVAASPKTFSQAIAEHAAPKAVEVVEDPQAYHISQTADLVQQLKDAKADPKLIAAAEDRLAKLQNIPKRSPLSVQTLDDPKQIYVDAMRQHKEALNKGDVVGAKKIREEMANETEARIRNTFHSSAPSIEDKGPLAPKTEPTGITPEQEAQIKRDLASHLKAAKLKAKEYNDAALLGMARTSTGLKGVVTGQPFEMYGYVKEVPQANIKSGLKVLMDSINPTAKKYGTVIEGTIKKPAVIEVSSGGDLGITEAVRKLYADDPAALKMMDDTKDPMGTGAELLARKASKHGYDGVSLSTPNVVDNILLDLREWKPTEAPKALAPKTLAPEGAVKPTEDPFDPKGFSRGSISWKKIHDPLKDFNDETSRIEKMIMGDLDAGTTPGVAKMKAEFDKHYKYPLTGLTPTQWWSDHPEFLERYGSEKKVGGKLLRMNNDAARDYTLLEKAGLNEKNFNEVERAVNGLEYDISGPKPVFKQTALNVSEETNRLAIAFRKAVMNRGYIMITGNDPTVPAILDAHALPHTRVQMTRLRDLQAFKNNNFANSSPEMQQAYLKVHVTAPDILEELAASKAQGKLRFQPWNDLDFNPNDQFVRFEPIKNRIDQIKDTIKHVEGIVAAGHQTDAAASLPQMRQAVTELEKLHEQLKVRDTKPRISRDFVPKRAWSAYTHVTNDPNAASAGFGYTKSLKEAVAQYLGGIRHKAYSDKVLYETHQMLKNPKLPVNFKEKLIDRANIIRGESGRRAHEALAYFANNTFGKVFAKEWTVDDSREMIGVIKDYTLVSKVMLSPVRYPIINMTHAYISDLPVLTDAYGSIRGGASSLFRANAQILANPGKWFGRAAAEGIISQDIELYEDTSPQGNIRKGLHKIGIANPLIKMTENYRKVLSWRAAELSAGEGKFSTLVRWASDAPYKNAVERNRAYARAFVRTTQFSFEPGERGLWLSKSIPGQLAGQLRTWEIGISRLYGAMLRNPVQYAKPMMMGLGTMFMFGGASVVGGMELWNWIRREALKHGYNMPQLKTGYQYLADTLGFEGALDDLGIHSLRQPFVTLSTGSVADLAGPAIGGVVQWVKEMGQSAEDHDAKRAGMATVGLISPQIRNAVEAAQEYAEGGLFGPNGVVTRDRSKAAIILRGLSVSESSRTEYYNLREDYAAALEGQNPTAAQAVLDEAARKGIVVDRRFMGYGRGKAKRVFRRMAQ